MSIEQIPLSRLALSDRNVRKTEKDADVEHLAADIAARGLKQNLIGYPDSFSDKIEITAGGRRLRALRLLAKKGDVDADMLVPVLVEEEGHSTETSLAENIQRVAMNAADEFAAYASVLDDYRAIDGIEDPAERVARCAHRFGVPISHVEGRLRLADLHPDILDALRTGTIGIEAAKAYATLPDHDLQRKVFAAQEKGSYNKHRPQDVRNAMRAKTYRLDDRRVLFVGLDTYRAAGGRVEREMFMGGDDAEAIVDTGLLDKLLKEAGQIAAAALAKKDGWADGVLCTWNGSYATTPKAPDGFVQKWHGGNELPKKARKTAIAIYDLRPDGSGLDLSKYYCFVPGSAEAQSNAGYTAETPEERAARIREQSVNIRAARLACPRFAGTAFEGRAFWPRNERWIDPVEQLGDDEYLVAVQIKVSREQMLAMRGDAEADYDRELVEREAAERQAAESAAAAASQARDADRPDPYDDELDADPDGDADRADKDAAVNDRVPA